MALATSKIGTQIVKEALNANINAVWHLCNHTNINKWSKYKPVVGNWPAVDGSYGFLRSDWSYVTRTPAKLGHFAGYEHDTSLAFPPILSIISENKTQDIIPMPGSTETNWNSYRCRCYKTTSSVRLSTTDIGLDEFYYGLKIVAGATTYYKTYAKIGNTTNGALNNMDVQAGLTNPTTSPSFDNLPYYIGTFEYTQIISSEEKSTWTTDAPTEVYNFPTITRDISATGYTGTFTVKNWVYSGNAVDGAITSMSWTATGVNTDLSTNIWSSIDTAPGWEISAKPDWITVTVYNNSNIAVPHEEDWQSSFKLKLVPSINTGSARSGAIDIKASDSSTLTIAVSQDAPIVQPTVSVITSAGWNITNDTGSITIGYTQLLFEFDHDYSGDTFYDLYIYDEASQQVYYQASDLRVRAGQTHVSTSRVINRAAVSGDVFTVSVGAIL